MKDCTSLTDEELVCDFGNSEKATDELILRYENVVKIKASIYTAELLEFDDLYQEGMLGLLSAIAHYNKDGKASFRTYADRCIENRMKNMVKRASRLSLTKESVERTVIDAHNRDCLNPEDVVTSKDDLRQKTEKIRSILSPFEAEIFDLFLHGCTYGQIADRLGITFKAVDNALVRVRRKLKSIF